MKFISLFAGIGGFDRALEQLGHEGVYANDIDTYCKYVYDNHFKTKLDLRDIRTVSESDIPDHDILCGGFPCQAFSIAGKRRGFEDTRGTLFFEIARIAKSKRPAYLFLENVKGLLSHDTGRTFETIMWTLDELGYDLQWQVCNSKNFGVPQNRERVFIIGCLRGTPGQQVFPLTGSYPEANEKFASTTIDANYWKGIDNHGARTAIIQLNQPTHSNDRIYSPEGMSPTLNTMQGGNRQPIIVTGSPTYKEGKRSIEYHVSNLAPTIRATQYKCGDNQPKVVTPTMNIRRLTPLECERLQGFPDNWTAEGINEKGEIVQISDTQRYKMCGNAVTVNTVYEIAKRAFSV